MEHVDRLPVVHVGVLDEVVVDGGDDALAIRAHAFDACPESLGPTSQLDERAGAYDRCGAVWRASLEGGVVGHLTRGVTVGVALSPLVFVICVQIFLLLTA